METQLRKLAPAVFRKFLRRPTSILLSARLNALSARASWRKRALIVKVFAAARRHMSEHAQRRYPGLTGPGRKKEQTPLPARDICRSSHPQDFSADVSVFRAHLPLAPPVVPARQSHWSVEICCRHPPRAPRGRGVSGQDKTRPCHRHIYT